MSDWLSSAAAADGFSAPPRDARDWQPPLPAGGLIWDLDFGDAPVSLLIGAEGAGKTSALAACHQRLCALGEQPVWLSITAAHTAPGRLAADLDHAMRAAQVLFLDGLDRLGASALEALARQVTAPGAPARVHLSDTRLRGEILNDHWLRGRMRLVGPQALRLDDAMAAQMLGPQIREGQAALLNGFCGGWAAGLAMIAHTPEAVAGILEAQNPVLPQTMADWFDHRLLRSWPAESLALLCDLAVPERFTPAILPLLPREGLWRRYAPDWSLIAPQLAEGCFLRPDSESGWFALQPALALHLRQHLQRHAPGRFHQMQRFTAEWLAASGYFEDAVRHAVHLPDHSDAARLIEAAGAISVDLRMGPYLTLGQLVPPAEAGSLPLVFFSQLYGRIRHGRVREAEIDFQEACRLTDRFTRIEAETDPALLRGWVSLFDVMFDTTADRAPTPVLIARMEESLHETLSPHPVLAISLSSVLAFLYLGQSRHAAAAEICQIGLGVHQGHPSNKAAIFVRQHQASVALASASVEKGLLYIADAERLAAIEGRSASYEVVTSAIHHAVLLHENNESERAAAMLEPILPLLPAVNGWAMLWDMAFSTLAMIRAQAGLDAEEVLAAGETFAREQGLPRLAALLAVTRVHCLLRRDAQAAGAALEQPALRAVLDEEAMREATSPFHLAVQVPAQLAQAAVLADLGRMREMQEGLDRINRPWLAEADQRLRFAWLVLAMRGAFARRRYNGAIDLLEAAVDLARRGGLVRRGIEARAHLIAVLDWALAHGRPVSAPVRGWIEAILRPLDAGESDRLRAQARQQRIETDALSLSPREAEIMILIAEGLITKEIARRLGISDGTVKSHRKNIHEKLGVRSRSQAILRARELLLI